MPSPTPFTNYYFQLELPGLDQAIGTFSQCHGLELRFEVFEYQEGGNNDFVHQLPGPVQYPNLVLTGMVTDQDALFKWFWATHTQAERKEITLTLKSRGKTPVVDVRRRVPGQLDRPAARGRRNRAGHRDPRDRPQRAEAGVDDAHPPGIPAREARDREPRQHGRVRVQPDQLHGLEDQHLELQADHGHRPARRRVRRRPAAPHDAQPAARRLAARPRPERQGHRQQAAEDDGDRRRRRWRRRRRRRS